MPKPVSTANMDPNFEAEFNALQAQAQAMAESASQATQVQWFRPALNGAPAQVNPFDYEGLSAPFDRTSSNQALVAAIKDGNNPGTVGDVVTCSVMINELSIMERAFRVRQTLRRCRATAHTIGRANGLGDPLGPFGQLGVEYVRSLLRQTKQAPTVQS